MLSDCVRNLIADLDEECARAFDKYGPYSSAHEAIGVLDEEVMELRAGVHANDADQIAAESLQVAAVAIRLSWEIRNVPAMRERSGARGP